MAGSLSDVGFQRKACEFLEMATGAGPVHWSQVWLLPDANSGVVIRSNIHSQLHHDCVIQYRSPIDYAICAEH